MKKNRLIFIFSALPAIFLLLLSAWGAYVIHQKAMMLAKPLSTPPDHGTSFIIEADLSKVLGQTNEITILNKVIQQRFSKLGISIFEDPPSGSRMHIVVPAKAPTDLVTATNLITKRGHLEFRLVHASNDKLVMNGDVPFGYELLVYQKTFPAGKLEVHAVLARNEAEAGLAGNIVNRAKVVRDATGQPQIGFALDKKSTAIFAEYTKTNISRQLAILVDGQLYAAPIVQTQISTGNCQISGHFTENEAESIVAILTYPLPVPTTVVETKTF